jgi:hypothetical protein
MNTPTITAVAHHQKNFGLDNQVKIRETNRHLFLLGSQRALAKKLQGKHDINYQQLYQQYGRPQENRLVIDLCWSDAHLCVSGAKSISHERSLC